MRGEGACLWASGSPSGCAPMRKVEMLEYDRTDVSEGLDTNTIEAHVRLLFVITGIFFGSISTKSM